MHGFYISAHFVDCLFTLLMVSFAVLKHLSWCSPSWPCLLSMAVLLVSFPWNHLSRPLSRRYSSVFSFRSFTVSRLILNLQFLSGCVWCNVGSSVNPLHVLVQVSQHLLSKRLSSSRCVLLAPLSRSADCTCMGLFLGFVLSWSVSVSLPLPYWFTYRSLVICFEMRRLGTSNFDLPPGCLGYSGSFVVSYAF